MSDLLKWEQDKNLYLFTSLTAGSSHIVTATNRLDTILRAARIPFTYIDTATNDSAKALFQRRGRGKKLPFLVKEGFVLGDMEQIEEWNEFGELKDAIGPVEAVDTSITTTPAKAVAGSTTTAAAPTPGAVPTPTQPVQAESSSPPAPTPGATPLPPATVSALQAAGLEAAALAKARQTAKSTAVPVTEPKEPTPTPVQGAEAIAEPPPLEEKTEDPTAEKTIEEVQPPAGVTTSVSPTPSRASSHMSPSTFVPEHFQPPPTTHRGSSLSLASDEEIKEVERRETITEEDEGEDSEDEKVAAVTKAVEGVKLDDSVEKSPTQLQGKKEEGPAVESET